MRPHQRLASIGLTIVIACFALMSTSMAHTAAAQDNGTLLADSGFRHVKVFNSGIWGLLYQAANLKGREYLRSYVVEIPEENL